MQASSQPAKIPLPWAHGAGSGYIRAIPTPSQQSSQAGAASFTDGFPPACFTAVSAGGVPPYGQDMNGILNQITGEIQWLEAGATPAYDATFSSNIGGYPKGALLASATFGNYWLSTADNNTSDPDTGGAGWAAITNPALDQVVLLDTSTTVNTLAVALPVGSLVQGTAITIRPANTNTGAVSLSANGGSAVSVLQGGNVLTGGELEAGWPYRLVMDQGSLHILGSGAGAVNVGAPSKAAHAVNVGSLVSGGASNSGYTTQISCSATFTAATKCVVIINGNVGSTQGITAAALSFSGQSSINFNESNWSGGGSYTNDSVGVSTAQITVAAGASCTITMTAQSAGNMTIGFNFLAVPTA